MNALDRLIAWVSPRSGRACPQSAGNQELTRPQQLAGAFLVVAGRAKRQRCHWKRRAGDCLRCTQPCSEQRMGCAWPVCGGHEHHRKRHRCVCRQPEQGAQPASSANLTKWAASRIDDINRLDFYGAQALCAPDDGRVWRMLRASRDSAPTFAVSLGIAVPEPDWLDTTKGTLGIEYSTEGKSNRVLDVRGSTFERFRLRVAQFHADPVSASDVIHVYRVIDLAASRRVVVCADHHRSARLRRLRGRRFAARQDGRVQSGLRHRARVHHAGWTVCGRQEPGATEIVPLAPRSNRRRRQIPAITSRLRSSGYAGLPRA